MTRRKFIVTFDRPADSMSIGPSAFFVMARSTRGAFQAVRNGFKPYITGCYSQELHVLHCEGVVSDKVGLTLPRRRYAAA